MEFWESAKQVLMPILLLIGSGIGIYVVRLLHAKLKAAKWAQHAWLQKLLQYGADHAVDAMEDFKKKKGLTGKEVFPKAVEVFKENLPKGVKLAENVAKEAIGAAVTRKKALEAEVKK